MGTLNKQTLIIEEFLPNLSHYLKDIYNIPLYNQEEFNNKFNLKVGEIKLLIYICKIIIQDNDVD